MVVADYAGNFPLSVFLLPDHNVFEYTTIIFTVFYMAKLMTADFYSSIIIDGIHL
ncbi:hypothetical protein D3C87_1855280 [compost metagenome]